MQHEISDWIVFFGRFHPLVLHLPIGFLVIAFALEILSRFPAFVRYQPAVGLVLGAGAAFSIIAAVLGLMLAQSGDYNGDLLDIHQWSGIAVAVVSCAAFLLRKGAGRKPLLDKIYLSAMSFMMISLVIAGHYGGSLTHGSDYLTEYMPNALRSIGGYPVKEKKPVIIKNLPEAQVFADIVYPILDSRCVSCHNQSKRKGELMMDTREALVAGGENGAVFVAGNPSESNMIQRINLPEDHDDHMPPKGKSQLSADQIKLLTWWVEQGAPFEKKVAEVHADEEIQSVLKTLVDPNANKSEVEILLASPVRPVDENILKDLRTRGVIVRPLAREIHWLQAHVTPAYRGSGDSLVGAFSQVSEQLTWLNLGGTETTDDVLRSVGKLKNLTRLHLENTQVTDEGLKHLKQLPFLEYLNLYGTQVTDSGIQELATLRNLKRLYVWQTSVTPDGISRLSEALPGVEVNSGSEAYPHDSVKRPDPVLKTGQKITENEKSVEFVKN